MERYLIYMKPVSRDRELCAKICNSLEKAGWIVGFRTYKDDAGEQFIEYYEAFNDTFNGIELPELPSECKVEKLQ